MRGHGGLKNIFADKATLVLREMLARPDRKWVTRDFISQCGISLGLAQGVLETMSQRGYVERIKKGPVSYSILADKDRVLEDWREEYRFGFNRIETYYSPDKNIWPRIKTCLKGKSYAFTLHSGANLITSFVLTDHVYFYFSPQDREREILDLRQQLDLKELVSGGNIHIIRPYYKNSVYSGFQNIKGYQVVSSLQLYLDLYHFQPRGREHAEYLKHLFEEEGKSLYESR
ncbi:MAG: hypothetical protein JW860_12230 [Sedimentisphaerales bacterium]|nr:hypothetical protein [Sedimentisphaerales bacterium]